MKKLNLMQLLEKIFIVILIILFFVGAIIVKNNWVSRKLAVKESAIKYTQTIATALSGQDILQLNALPEDEGTAPYNSLKNRLISYTQNDNDFRFVYLFKIINDRMYFMVDSEEETSEYFSPPGQEYTEITIDNIILYEQNETVFEDAYTDSYGTWISVITPIVNLETNSVIAYLGIDYYANTFYLEANQNGFIYAFLVIAIYIAIIILFFLFHNIIRLEKKEDELELLISQMPQGLALHEVVRNEDGKLIDFSFLSINKGFENILKVKAEDIIGKRALDVFPNLEKYWLDAFDKVAQTGKPIKFSNYFSDTGQFLKLSIYSPKKNQFASIIEDVTEEINKQKEIKYLGEHDFLTGLYNRRYYEQKLASMNNEKHYPLTIFMMDINGLKILNDAYGHKVGDEAIKSIAHLLQESFPKHSVVARIGGDEFAVISPKTIPEKAEKLKKYILQSVLKLTIENIPLSIAIGYETKDTDSISIEDIFKNAEKFMYKNKLSEGLSMRNHAIQAIFETLTKKYDGERIHSLKVSELCGRIGEKLALNEDAINELKLAGKYHDIGKISLPDAILHKPGRLTPEEFDVVKTHTQIGYQILRAADEYSDLAEYALFHHERWDGKGYPNGLYGKDIPLFARIICLCDSYEAMTSERPYKSKLTHEEAIAEIIKNAGKQFDPELAKIFIEKVLAEK